MSIVNDPEVSGVWEENWEGGVEFIPMPLVRVARQRG